MRLSALALCIGSLFLVACDEVLDGAWNRVQEDFHYSYALNPGGKIEVENQNGGIDISGWDQNTVDISGTKYANTPERELLPLQTQSKMDLIRKRVVEQTQSDPETVARLVRMWLADERNK